MRPRAAVILVLACVVALVWGGDRAGARDVASDLVPRGLARWVAVALVALAIAFFLWWLPG